MGPVGVAGGGPAGPLCGVGVKFTNSSQGFDMTEVVFEPDSLVALWYSKPVAVPSCRLVVVSIVHCY